MSARPISEREWLKGAQHQAGHTRMVRRCRPRRDEDRPPVQLRRVVGRQRQEGPLMYNDDKDPDRPAPPPNTPERWTFDAACQCDDTYGDYPWCPACYPEASA